VLLSNARLIFMPPKPNSSVTLLDVAKALGLSRATVSLVLRESPVVAKATRERVLAAFKEMGYVYNRSAAGMRNKRSNTVAVIVNDLANTRFTVLVRSIESMLSRHGFVTLLGNSDESVDKQLRFLETVRQYNIDGIMMCPADATSVEDMNRFLSWRIPLVCVARHVEGAEVDYVGSDSKRGMAMATQHLISLGHTRIALLGGHERSSLGRERLAGYLSALEAAGIKRDDRLIAPQRQGQPLQSEGKRLIAAQLRMKNPPTAAVCHNDAVAFGVILGLRALNLEAGRDFGVVGFDDVPEAALWEPPLTTVGSQLEQVGQWAAELMLSRINDPVRLPTRIAMAPTLVVRESCGPARRLQA
jgi:LacI family transcriptional regulator